MQLNTPLRYFDPRSLDPPEYWEILSDKQAELQQLEQEQLDQDNQQWPYRHGSY